MAGKSSCKVVLNYAAVGALLKSAEMREAVYGIASKAAQAAGSGYDCDSKMLDTRVVASVYTDTKKAAKDNLENNTLLKAVQR